MLSRVSWALAQISCLPAGNTNNRWLHWNWWWVSQSHVCLRSQSHVSTAIQIQIACCMYRGFQRPGLLSISASVPATGHGGRRWWGSFCCGRFVVWTKCTSDVPCSLWPTLRAVHWNSSLRQSTMFGSRFSCTSELPKVGWSHYVSNCE